MEDIVFQRAALTWVRRLEDDPASPAYGPGFVAVPGQILKCPACGLYNGCLEGTPLVCVCGADLCPGPDVVVEKPQ